MKQISKAIMAGMFCASATADVASFFNESNEGWTAAGDTVAGVEFLPAGGNPGGGLRVNDNATGGVWYWVAPANFLGNQISAFGKSLKFDLRQVIGGGADQFATDDVILEGASLRLVFDLNPEPPVSGAWAKFDVPLRADAGWKIGGVAATEEQIRAALANITRLQIRGEYQTGPDTGYLDNVVLGSEPSTIQPVLGIKFLPNITITGALGSRYLIEYSEPLTPDSWVALTTITLTESPFDFLDKSAEGKLNRNYRATLVP
jgi:hypothetical protein